MHGHMTLSQLPHHPTSNSNGPTCLDIRQRHGHDPPFFDPKPSSGQPYYHAAPEGPYQVPQWLRSVQKETCQGRPVSHAWIVISMHVYA